MKRILLIAVLLSMAACAFAVGDQAYWGMFAETSQNKVAGMPEMPQMPNMPDMSQIPPGMRDKMPHMIPGMGGPTRSFTIRLWSPGIAPANATASVAPPVGLKQGTKLDLELYRPKPGETGDEVGGQPANPNMTIKFYWGSSATVKPGQPKVFVLSKLTPEQQHAMRARTRKTNSYFYKPNWTTAYWPTKSQPGDIAKDASLVGNYALTTSYTGNVSIDCPTNVNFLSPIQMTSPALSQPIAFDAAMEFKWNPIANLLGSHAMIVGMEGQNTLIIWSSSEVWQEGMMSADWGYLQMAEVLKYVNDTVMMKGDRTTMTVPAGIFANSDSVNLMMTGYGPGAARDETQPLPRIQTKTSLSIMLGGKMMQGMQ